MRGNKFLRITIISAFLLIGVMNVPGGSFAKSNAYTLRLAHIMNSGHPNSSGAIKFAELVKEKTNGQVNIDVFPSAQLGNEKEIFDALTIGAVDFGMIGFGEASKRYPPMLIFDTPYVAKDREHLLRILNSPVAKGIFETMTKKTDVKVLGTFYYGTRHVTTTNTVIKEPKDMNGLKLRCPDQPICVAYTKAMGATPTPMALTEVYLALSQGVIDGQENPAATIAENKFYEVQKYLIKTGHLVNGNCLYMSNKKYKLLPPKLAKAVLDAANETCAWINQKAFEVEDAYLNQIKKHGVIFIEPNRDLFSNNMTALYKEYEKIWGKGLLEKIRSIK
jgi:tripartite ATP-independent transporter DctP family solute receptor